jgi:XTP/dITP diphosphohydrolase
MPPALLLATTNPGKAEEFRELLSECALELFDLRAFRDPPAVRETGRTYEENALLKAKAYARWAGMAALADDSGLEVDALGGAPGVDAAHFAGPQASDRENVQKLLAALAGVPTEQRTARFRCVLVVAHPDGRWIRTEGMCEGIILNEPRGSSGFGYDPVFFYPPLGKTFAELSREEKNRVSHRARAAAELRRILLPFLEGEASKREDQASD